MTNVGLNSSAEHLSIDVQDKDVRLFYFYVEGANLSNRTCVLKYRLYNTQSFVSIQGFGNEINMRFELSEAPEGSDIIEAYLQYNNLESQHVDFESFRP